MGLMCESRVPCTATRGGHVAVGLHPLVGKGPRKRDGTHQCRSGNRGGKDIVSKAVSRTLLSGFQKPFRERCCLVPADGDYEWKREGARKQPYSIRLKNERSFAGLWDRWNGEDGKPMES